MSKERTVKIDPFVQFLMDERKFAYTYEAAKEIGMDPQMLVSYARRGVRSIPAMVKLAAKFDVPISRVGEWISQNIDVLAASGSETDLINLAS